MGKPRIALTIAYNAMNHLKHGRFVEFMVNNFDLWVIVEGCSRNGGSTSWCKHMNLPHHSTDGTAEYVKELAESHKNVRAYSHHKHYKSKDEQVNKGIEIIKTAYQSGWLWQVDVDEHWTIEDMEAAERELWRLPFKAAEFQFNHYVKRDIIAVGEWGSGWVTRLWKWTGQSFASHEPAVLHNEGKPIKLRQKFNHYSLIFEDDVRHKAKSYKGHEPIYLNWKKLDTLDWTQPNHVSCLFGTHNPIGRTESYLIKIQTTWDAIAENQNQENHADDTLTNVGSELSNIITEHATITRNRKYHRRGGRNVQEAQDALPGGIGQRAAS